MDLYLIKQTLTPQISIVLGEKGYVIEEFKSRSGTINNNVAELFIQLKKNNISKSKLSGIESAIEDASNYWDNRTCGTVYYDIITKEYIVKCTRCVVKGILKPVRVYHGK